MQPRAQGAASGCWAPSFLSAHSGAVARSCNAVSPCLPLGTDPTTANTQRGANNMQRTRLPGRSAAAPCTSSSSSGCPLLARGCSRRSTCSVQATAMAERSADAAAAAAPAMTSSQFLRPHILKLAPYTPIEPFEVLSARYGRKAEDIIKLDANENPYGPPEEVKQALASMPFPHIYPDPETRRLRRALAEYHGIPMEHLLVRPGVAAGGGDLRRGTAGCGPPCVGGVGVAGARGQWTWGTRWLWVVVCWPAANGSFRERRGRHGGAAAPLCWWSSGRPLQAPLGVGKRRLEQRQVGVEHHMCVVRP